LLKGAINKLKKMIGTSTGAKNNLSLKLLIRSGSFQIKELTIIEIGMKFAVKIYCLRMLKNTNEHYKNKEKLMKLLCTILCL
jgi:hypothetical protein